MKKLVGKLVVILAMASSAGASAGYDYQDRLDTLKMYMAQFETRSLVFVDYNIGTALNAENVKSAVTWEVRVGKRIIRPLTNTAFDSSFGFSNYYSENLEAAPDRLVPGDLGLRTFNEDGGMSLHFCPVTIRLGGGVGWTWIQHSAGTGILASNLDPYEPDEKIISVSERVHDALSATFRTGLEFEITPSVSLGFDAKYLFLHTTRERDVLLYEENSSKAYADRYYTYHTVSPVSFDNWTMAFQFKKVF